MPVEVCSLDPRNIRAVGSPTGTVFSIPSTFTAAETMGSAPVDLQPEARITVSLSIGPPEMGVGQVELAAGIGRKTKAQAGLLLKSDLDVKLDLMLTPFR